MTRPRLQSQSGSALVTALLVMMIMMTLGVAVLGTVDTQQHQSGQERTRESTFQLSEAALNAQIYQLSSQWPACSDASCASVEYPVSCTQGVVDDKCPNASALAGAYDGVDYRAGVQWTTEVRDDDKDKPDFYSDSLLNGPRYDANGNGYVWVRSTSVLHGHRRTLVALVKAEPTTLDMPHKTLVAGKFDVTNNGNKVMIDNNGGFSPPGEIVVRCAPAGTTAPLAGCAGYENTKSKGSQVEPQTVSFNPAQPTSIAPDALDSLRMMAAADGNYWATGCPGSLQGDHPGETVFIEDASSCPPFNGNDNYNTVDKPGVVIIGKGSITINGGATFYGVIYDANLDNSSDYLIELGGTVSINGSIQVDGPGGIDAGSSKVNLVWNPNVFNAVKGFGTANIVQNTFREIDATS